MRSAVLLVSLGAVAQVYSLPEYARRDGNESWVPQEWMAPGPDDSKPRQEGDFSSTIPLIRLT